MGSVSLAEYVSSKGLAELANPASTKLSGCPTSTTVTYNSLPRKPLMHPQAGMGQKNGKKQKGQKTQQSTAHDPRLAISICFRFNQGNCLKPAGTCVNAKGQQRKHICDFLPDQNNPTRVCDKEHIRKDFHK
jgi:hypothetical protein